MSLDREITFNDIKEYCDSRCLRIISDDLLFKLTHGHADIKEPVITSLADQLSILGKMTYRECLDEDTKKMLTVHEFRDGTLVTMMFNGTHDNMISIEVKR